MISFLLCVASMVSLRKQIITVRKGSWEMTADERIERLLNRFGQTMEDLPKPAEEGEGYAYEFEHRNSALEAALYWTKANSSNPFSKIIDYICHLADVIDKLEIALETAARMTTCGTCANEFLEECRSEEHCNYKVCDWCLRDKGRGGCVR